MLLRPVLAAGCAAVVLVGALPAAAASLTTFAESSGDGTVDNNFNDLCGGADNFDCEFAVAQGVAGNRANNGNVESQVFDRLLGTTVATSEQTQSWSESSVFTLSYDADGGAGGLIGLLSFTAVGANPIFDEFDLSDGPGGANNPDGPAKSLVLRASRASLTNLLLDSSALPAPFALPDVLALPTDRSYLYIGGFGITGDWTLTGTLETNPAFNNSGTGFQAKITDLDVPTTPIPLPAGLPLLIAGLGAVGALRLSRRG